MKRKSSQIAGNSETSVTPTKKSKATKAPISSKSNFRDGLFDENTLTKYTEQYADSAPYKHAVISSLMDDSLLRSVRAEVRENVHFTPKETDIYKIHQSGDLANLDGLDNAALAKLPSLLKLRDSLYSPEFRKYVASITGSGDLSGRKTDMAINVYTPGCHLLCHDDVIGSRRVSYILYLTDPDIPWKKEWGGALRLYPTKDIKEENGEITKIPSPDFTKVIPPAWNQLSFFAVQPGQSFHDVEEVYHADTKEHLEADGGRVRMAISGWFHIPQIGEDGYVEGAEEQLAKKSSLMQLQGQPDRYDFPQGQFTTVEEKEETSEAGLEAADIDFLLKYMAPTYLTPDTMEQVTEHFSEQSSVTLDGLLSVKFSARVREWIEKQESLSLPADSEEIDKATSWKVARPPHKHRFLYLQPSPSLPEVPRAQNASSADEISPIQELLDVFLPSQQFRQWLELASECRIENLSVLARRFRRGLDYSLATSHEGNPRLEVSLCLTPSSGWIGSDDPEEDPEEVETEVESPPVNTKGKSKSKLNGKSRFAEIQPEPEPEPEKLKVEEEEIDVGGHEVYMAADDDDTAGDAAIYKASTDAEDDNVLFTVSPSWNKMSIVLRDSGVLKFVKFVSSKATGDRWDIGGTFGVAEDDEDDEDDEEEEEDTTATKAKEPTSTGTGSGSGTSSGTVSANSSFGLHSQISLEDSGDEEEFKGFPESEDSDSE